MPYIAKHAKLLPHQEGRYGPQACADHYVRRIMHTQINSGESDDGGEAIEKDE